MLKECLFKKKSSLNIRLNPDFRVSEEGAGPEADVQASGPH